MGGCRGLGARVSRQFREGLQQALDFLLCIEITQGNPGDAAQAPGLHVQRCVIGTIGADIDAPARQFFLQCLPVPAFEGEGDPARLLPWTAQVLQLQAGQTLQFPA